MHPLFRHLPPPDRDYTRHTRSTVMFGGDFGATLEQLIEEIDELLSTCENDLFCIDSVLSGNHNIKVRLTHHETQESLIANIVFRYRPKEVKYGQIDVDLTLSGFGKKGVYAYIGKFDLLDTQQIIREILGGLYTTVKGTQHA